MTDSACCGNCRFYRNESGLSWGHWRRNPPLPLVVKSTDVTGNDEIQSLFAEVTEETWCGEHQRKDEETKATK